MRLLSINKNSENIDTLLILPEKATNSLPAVLNNYITPLGEFRGRVLVVGVFTPEKGSLKKSIAMEELEAVYELVETYGIDKIMVANTDYYKFILEEKKKPAFEREIGSLREKDGLKILPIVNYQVLSFQPNKKELLNKGLGLLKALYQGMYRDNKEELFKTFDIKLCNTYEEAKNELKKLINKDLLAMDIETTGLNFWEDELLTVSFSEDDKSAVVIPLHKVYSDDYQKLNKLVKSFFENYKGRFILHNGKFDLKFFVYRYWMQGLGDVKGAIKGANYFKGYEDTLQMAYLCYNSVDRPELGLKKLVYDFLGNYDDDIDQSNLINTNYEDTGKYNGLDTIGTYYLYNKLSNLLLEENQEDIYFNIYKPALLSLLKVELQGVVFDIGKMNELNDKLKETYNKALDDLRDREAVKETTYILKEREMIKRNAKLKTKQLTIDDIKLDFNPKSSNQVRVLLYDVLGLPVLEKTKSGSEATGKEVLENLLKEVGEDSEEYQIVYDLLEIAKVKTVITSFTDKIPKIVLDDIDGNKRIVSNFNTAKVVSGRLSSSGQINFQNTPATSGYGKDFKKTQIAPKGYLVAYSDFSALNKSGA